MTHGVPVSHYSLEDAEVVDGLLRMGAAKDVAASHQDVGTSLDKTGSRLAVDTTVNLDERMGTAATDEVAQLVHLLDGVLDEHLTAKAWIDTHEQHHIDVANDVFQQGDRTGGVERHTSLHACSMDLLNGTVQMGTGLYVDVHHHGTQTSRLLDVVLRMDDHVVDVEQFGTLARHSLHDGKAKRDIGDEDAVHHVEVKPFGLAAVDHVNVAVQMQEVSRQQ